MKTCRDGDSEMTLMVWSRRTVWVKVPEHWSKPPFHFTVYFNHKNHSFPHSENSRRHKESRTNLWYWFFFFTIHWLEFKFKVENYSPWGSRNLSMGGTSTKSSRIRVFTVHWWFCLQSKLQPLSGQQTLQLSFSRVLNVWCLWGFFRGSGSAGWVSRYGDISTLISRALWMFWV